jgi:folate-binding protein YgfZ
VTRAPSTSSTRDRIRPDDSTASPTRLEVMNRIGKRRGAMTADVYTSRALAPKAAPRHMAVMTGSTLEFARLDDRAVIAVTGEDWRSFLQSLLTQDVETLAPGELRFGALLTPQGRLLYDLFLLGRDDGCWLDCAAERRDDLVTRLTIYRLRAKVTVEAMDAGVFAAWGGDTPPEGWVRDPRLPALGFRHYGTLDVETRLDADAYDAHRLAVGVPGAADWGSDATYPIEANFDLLHGIDFRKGCFVGQETTSRMKRRGTIKSRMAPIAVEGAAVKPGAELLAGDLRAGEVLSVVGGAAMALLRLDRLTAGPLTFAEGGRWRPEIPAWLEAATKSSTPLPS